ncbi:GNAT family N-acetyltransferase [Curtobacterium sp. RRHDQ10]|uniref:GNAT family N-acetyltransferase n=1 Tax=Curtobacterium phyllosphaerae TaxID=3413379 RepID=UPI003BF1802C
MTAGVRLVPVVGQEARSAVRALRASVMREPFTAAGLPDAVVADLVATQSTAQERAYRAEWPDSVDHLVVDGDRPVGRCWTAVVTDAAGVPTAVRVLDLAIAPAARRTRMATACLQSVIAQADAVGVDCVLGVRADNLPARALYRSLGFVEDDADGAAAGADLQLRHAARSAVCA